MIGWPNNFEERTSYKMWEAPKPAGYWALYAGGSQMLKFSIYKKPSFIHRWFTAKLLGWTWEDEL
jgi:hypothetical protein